MGVGERAWRRCRALDLNKVREVVHLSRLHSVAWVVVAVDMGLSWHTPRRMRRYTANAVDDDQRPTVGSGGSAPRKKRANQSRPMPARDVAQ